VYAPTLTEDLMKKAAHYRSIALPLQPVKRADKLACAGGKGEGTRAERGKGKEREQKAIRDKRESDKKARSKRRHLR